MVGASGTGKTSIIAAHILNGGLPQELWIPVCVTLSSRTSANMLQEQVHTVCCAVVDLERVVTQWQQLVYVMLTLASWACFVGLQVKIKHGSAIRNILVTAADRY